MTTHELQSMPAVEFFQHIAEGFEGVEKLKRYSAGNYRDAHTWRGWPNIVAMCIRRAEIQHNAAHRLNAWLKKQVTTKMLSL